MKNKETIHNTDTEKQLTPSSNAQKKAKTIANCKIFSEFFYNAFQNKFLFGLSLLPQLTSIDFLLASFTLIFYLSFDGFDYFE